ASGASGSVPFGLSTGLQPGTYELRLFAGGYALLATSNSFTVSPLRTVSVTPSRSGFSFTPASRTYTNVTIDQTAQNFTATNVGSAALYYIHPDHLNTPRLIANSTGTAVWRWDQGEPFGNDVPNNNPSGVGAFDFPLRFPGQYFDRETFTYYNLMRDYDSTIGRYIQSDPIGIKGLASRYGFIVTRPLSALPMDGAQFNDETI